MRNVWKWILGVILVLLVAGAIGAGAFLWRSRMGEVSYRSMPFHHSWQNGPMMHGDQFDPRQAGPMMRGFRPFRPFGGFFALGGLLRLIILGALLYGAYWLGRRNARVVMEPRQPRTPQPPPAPPVEPAPPAPTE
jgi:hypothetical protein